MAVICRRKIIQIEMNALPLLSRTAKWTPPETSAVTEPSSRRMNLPPRATSGLSSSEPRQENAACFESLLWRFERSSAAAINQRELPPAGPWRLHHSVVDPKPLEDPWSSPFRNRVRGKHAHFDDIVSVRRTSSNDNATAGRIESLQQLLSRLRAGLAFHLHHNPHFC